MGQKMGVRRMHSWVRLSVRSSINTGILLLITATVLTACSNDNSSSRKFSNNEIELKSGKLVAVTDEAELNQFLRKGIQNSFNTSTRFNETIMAGPESNATDSATGESNADKFSGTYTLEANVDEADIVKYDGSYLFIAEQVEYFCCAYLEDFMPHQAVIKPAIRVLSTAPTEPSATEITRLTPTLPENSQITGLYQKDDTLVSLATTSAYGFYGDAWIMPRYWQQGSTAVTLFDISDINHVSESWNATIDGSLVSSRRIGNTLYLVTRYTPDLQLEYSVKKGDDVDAENVNKINRVALNDLLPHIKHDNKEDNLFAATDCYLGNTDTVDGYSIITTITAIPLDNPSQFKSRCYNGETQGVYVSDAALYLTFFNWQAGKTWIHKFALADDAIEYRGTGEVEGSLSYRLDADFYLSEYNGDLRVISSVWNYSERVFLGIAERVAASKMNDNVDHRLTVLRESSSSATLETIATLPNKAHPQEIGKPNEDLYGVRFFKDRAYIVTFERMDPLYILDLSDPTNPYIAGELELPGFSDFLHPISENLLLGIGKNVGDQGDFSFIDGVKIELFDVSNPSSPTSLGAISIGDRGTESQVFSNRHAFTYLEMNDNHHRFTLPVDRYVMQDKNPENWSWGEWQDTGLYLFDINNISSPSIASLTQTGSMIVDSAASVDALGYPEYYENRSVLHDNAVFYIYGDKVWSAFWSDVTGMVGPF